MAPSRRNKKRTHSTVQSQTVLKTKNVSDDCLLMLVTHTEVLEKQSLLKREKKEWEYRKTKTSIGKRE